MADVCPTCGSKRKGIRSGEQHRRFFGVVRAAYHHWPESHSRQFSSEEECRKFLEMKAGHREVGARIPLTGIRKEQAMMLAEAAIRAAGSYAIPVIHGSELIVWKPKSIGFESMGHKAFCELSSAIDEIIHDVFGMSGDDLLQSWSEVS